MDSLKRKTGILWILLVLATGAFGLGGCEEGAFEEAGEEVDEAGDEIEEGVE